MKKYLLSLSPDSRKVLAIIAALIMASPFYYLVMLVESLEHAHHEWIGVSLIVLWVVSIVLVAQWVENPSYISNYTRKQYQQEHLNDIIAPKKRLRKVKKDYPSHYTCTCGDEGDNGQCKC